MASKYLRRLIMRSRIFFFNTTEVSCTTADNKLKPMQGLCNYNWNTMQGPPVRSLRASCLPLQGSHCLPSSSATHNSSADEGNYNEEKEEEKQLARSHSCSKLQGKQQLVPSFGPLMHRASSHSHLHDNRQSKSCKLHDFTEENWSSPTCESKYTRSWSSPSLHIGRHKIKLPHRARSFSGSQSKDDSRGKRAPKGHVAVYVEAGRERHVVPIAYLSHPHFEALLKRAESEFGFGQQGPGLHIPCSLSELHHTLQHIRTQAALVPAGCP